MQVIAEKLVFSDSNYESIQRQISLILGKIQQNQQRELLDAFIEQIFSVDSVLKVRNIQLFDFVLNKMSEIQMILPYDQLFERIRGRKEFEILIIYIKYVLRCKSQIEEQNISYHKSVDQFLKEKLFKFINISDQTYLWRTQFIQKFAYVKEVTLLNQNYKHPNKKIMELDMQEYNYAENIYRITLIYEFLIKNKKMFPFLDFSEIMMYWILSIKGQNDKEIHLLCQMIQEFHNICFHNLNQMLKPFSIFFDFLKYEYKDDEYFDPKKSLKYFIMSFKQQQLATLTEQTLWRGIDYINPDAWHYTFKNLIMMTTDLKVSTILLALSQFMIHQKIFGPLQRILDSFTAGFYTYLKFQAVSAGAVQLLKLFIIGSSCAQKVYLKHSVKIQQALQDNSIQIEIKTILCQIAQCLIKKYQDSTDTNALSSVVQQFYENNQIQSQQFTPEQIDQMISQLNWLNFQGQQNDQAQSNNQAISQNVQNPLFQIQTSNKCLRGLLNLGNTCYMNSYLQALYMTKEFRYRVFKINLAEVMHGGSKQSIQSNTQQDSKMEIDEQQVQKSDSSMQEEINDKSATENEKKKANIALIEKQTKIIKFGTVFQLQKLFSLLFKSKRTYINPAFFKGILPEFFRFSYAQQDASEFGRIFLDQLERSVQNTNDNKLLDDYFIGQYDHTITCLKCKNQFISKEKFLDVSLNFSENQDSTVTFNGLLQHNFKPEVFEGDNKYDCSICNEKNDAQKDTQISYLPNYVILTLNRFQYDLKTFKKIKLLQQIDIPEEIDLSYYQKNVSQAQSSFNCLDQDLSPISQTIDEKKMVCENQENSGQEMGNQYQNDKQMIEEPQQQESQKINKNIYQLYSIVVHRGSTAESGHYFTYSRESSDENCKWILFDDSNISFEDSLQNVLGTFTTQSTNTPYLLFYQNKYHASKYQANLNENAYKLSDKLMFSIENDDRQFMKEMENQNKAFSLLNTLKINHQQNQQNSQIYPFRKDDEDDSEGGNNYQGGGQLGFGGMGNNAIF
ncbi:ubiquitin carboxy-terminal hydrolase (macronuclear) [Tetrahymena thermophila SB210]|uniref:Ubiquitin carboxy-terminal hydrolase n=1 Tax=Tetrahymena thermophila (strain SB210) TaxID=312017 RepID=I7ML37_TETTS|nr:ubiquitin carboxy-terminal hydrolase [Tetrahymena thermophila SB210]EAS01106.2 ubiquitin carboxy-terminal hydrolase [Tetrahymena thermophila SB210]|eukprot:XP_001021351.2 ubiquitin carboxy-terminal hydrolase [Tetrahymena thermophila SB210]